LPHSVHGRTYRDLITLRDGLNPRQELVALVHETAHWLAHRGAHSAMHCTVFEYEAEAVEAMVLARLGLARHIADPAAAIEDATDNLLSASVTRAICASDRICAALGLKAQTPVHFQAAPRKEIVFEYEQYGMGDFFGLPEAL